MSEVAKQTLKMLNKEYTEIFQAKNSGFTVVFLLPSKEK